MKIAFVQTNNIVCGGVIVPFEYVSRLKKLGYEADIYAEQGNEMLSKQYNVYPKSISCLSEFTDDDVIIAVRWEQCEMLEQYKGKKYQLVQGKDLIYYGESPEAERLKYWRNNQKWVLIGVSEYCLKDWGRGIVIPNGVNERFFEDLGLEKDIDALIEGNNEHNKNILYAINKAKEDGHKSIVWFGRETEPIEGVECISNPSQNEIPKLYQRAKHFYKYSHSEGFCLPLLEAMASGCIIHSHDMGGNTFWYTGMTVDEGYQIATEFNWDNSVQKLINIL